MPDVSEEWVRIRLRMSQDAHLTPKRDDVSDGDDVYDDKGCKVQEDDAKFLCKVGDMVYLLNNDDSTLN